MLELPLVLFNPIASSNQIESLNQCLEYSVLATFYSIKYDVIILQPLLIAYLTVLFST